MRDGREGFEKALIERYNRGDLRLLEHDFRNPDGVGVTRPPPRKRARIGAEPLKQRAANGSVIQAQLPCPCGRRLSPPAAKFGWSLCRHFIYWMENSAVRTAETLPIWSRPLISNR